MAKKKKIVSKFDIDYDLALDQIEEQTDNQSVILTVGQRIKGCISSGSLCFDVITGGGYAPGRNTQLTGPEASGKSSLIYHSVANSVAHKIRTNLGDAEGSTDPDYMGNILSLYGMDLPDLFGLKDKKGEYIRRPLLRHYQPSLIEPYFRLMKRSAKLFPDRVRKTISGKDKWFDVYSDKIVERNNGKAQALWILDSLPSLQPEDFDLDDERGGMAAQANTYSEVLRGFPSLIARKRIAFVTVNQIRVKPGVMFGNPEYETCGNAVKHLASVRVKMTPVVFSNVNIPWEGKKIDFEEDSWDGEGTDKYRLIRIKTTKNKVFTPYKTSYIRLWVGDKNGNGYGIDPVFDTAWYLKETGQLLHKGNSFYINSKDLGIHKKVSWMQFKKRILDPQFKGKLRKKCFDQIRRGVAFDMYFDQQAKHKPNKEE